nr:hypothetical protein [uncultured Oscillibacter sp.]
MKDNKNSPAYKAGVFLAVLLSACIAAVAVAATIKFILWLF